MRIAMIGLGRMGGNIVRRLLRGGHEAVVFDRNQHLIDDLVKEGAVGATGLDDLRGKLAELTAVETLLIGTATVAT